jgi:PTH1 family peptidyl-tRNA hydrolase
LAGVNVKIIVGLGNPGDQYARTRHNAGFWFADELARRHGGVFRLEPRHQAEMARVRIGAADVWLVKPMSFMNRSGGPVGSIATFYKVPPEEILVGYDEMDFEPGVVRLRQGGGAGGHNGIRELLANVGDVFWRLRIGVGRPGVKGGPSVDHVLSRPSAEDEKLIKDGVTAAVDNVSVLLEQGAAIAMNKLHSRGGAPAPIRGGADP